MEGGFGVVTHELIELFIRLAFDTGADFAYDTDPARVDA